MDLLRHWIVRPKRPGDRDRVITLADGVAEWERLGYTVDGPFVPEADAGAVDLLREVHDLLAPADVDDPSAVPLAVDKLAAYLDGGQ
jgi:hypothetical protein